MNLLLIANILFGTTTIIGGLILSLNKCTIRKATFFVNPISHFQSVLLTTSTILNTGIYISKVFVYKDLSTFENDSTHTEFIQSSRNKLNIINRTQSSPIDFSVDRLNKII